MRQILTGSTYNAGGGDRNRDAFIKTNWNTWELYSSAVNSPYFFLDTFKREDTSAGNIGIPTLSSDGLAWTPYSNMSTAGGEVANTTCYIRSGSCRTPIGDILYLPRQLDFVPGIMGCEFELIEGNDLSAVRLPLMTMAIGNKEDGCWINNIIHCYFSPYSLVMQVQSGQGNFLNLTNIPIDSASVERNKKMKMQLILDNDVCLFRVNDWHVVAKDPIISRIKGKYVYWEIYYSEAATSADECVLHSLWAGQSPNISPTYPNKSGKLWTPIGEYNGIQYKGENSLGAIATATLTASPDINTGSYTVYWRGRIPVYYELSASQAYGMWNLCNNSAGATNNGPNMYISSEYYTHNAQFFVQQGTGGAGLFIKRRYEQAFKENSGRIVDLFFTRTGSNAELYIDGVYYPTESTNLGISLGTSDWSSSVISDYFHIGAYNTTATSFRGEIYNAALLNTVIPHRDMTNIQNGIIPNRLKWANNVTLTSGVLVPDKCYRIVSCSADYYYTGCTPNQEFHFMTSGSTKLALNLYNESVYNLKTISITSNNPVVQVGFMGFWDGTHGTNPVFIDRSSNQYHAVCSVLDSSSLDKQSRNISSVLSNVGDVDYTINSYSSPSVIFYSTSIGSDRTVTLPTTGMVKGDTYKIVRTVTGAGKLTIGALKTIPANTSGSVEIIYDGTNWKLTNYSTL